MEAVKDRSEDYPVTEALDIIETFSLGQEGEPQLITFGESFKHYAGLTVSEQKLRFGSEEFSIPLREFVLLTSYSDLDELVADFKKQMETGDELFKQHKQLLIDQGVLTPYEIAAPERLPRTTAAEEAIDAFEANRLSLENIRVAAERRVQRSSNQHIPKVAVMNAETGQKSTFSYDVAQLIANDTLRVTRGRTDWHGMDYVSIQTCIETGEFFKQEATQLGIDPDNSAIVSRKSYPHELWPSRSLFASPTTISNDFWTIDGKYDPADAKEIDPSRPPRHSLKREGGFRRAEHYTADDFLDAAQSAVNYSVEFLSQTSGSKTITLQPLASMEHSFHTLRSTLEDRGYELGYSMVLSLSTPVINISAVRDNGHIEKYLVTGSPYGTRLAIENASRELQHWQTPRIKKIGSFLTRKLARA